MVSGTAKITTVEGAFKPALQKPVCAVTEVHLHMVFAISQIMMSSLENSCTATFKVNVRPEMHEFNKIAQVFLMA